MNDNSYLSVLKDSARYCKMLEDKIKKLEAQNDRLLEEAVYWRNKATPGSYTYPTTGTPLPIITTAEYKEIEKVLTSQKS